MSQQQVPPVDPKAIKPGRIWYAVAVVLVVVTIGAGFTVFALGLSTVAANVPRLDTVVEPGASTTVELSESQDWAVYAASRGDAAPAVECVAESEDGTANLSSGNTSFSFSEGGERWHLVYEVSVDATGDYTFTCDSGVAVESFAVGDAVDVGGFVGGIFGSIGGLVGIPCFGIVVGGVIILIVAMRRSSSRKRLLSEQRNPESPGAW